MRPGQIAFNNPLDNQPFDNIATQGFWTTPFHTNQESGDSNAASARIRQFTSQLALATGGLGRFVPAVANFARSVHGFADTLVASQRQRAGWTGASSLAVANLDTNRMFRDMEFGKQTQRSFVDLTKALDRLERALHPFEVSFQNALNELAKILADFATAALEFIRNTFGENLAEGAMKQTQKGFRDPLGWASDMNFAYWGIAMGSMLHLTGKDEHGRDKGWGAFKAYAGIDMREFGLAAHHEYALEIGKKYEDMTDTEKAKYDQLMQQAVKDDAEMKKKTLYDPKTGVFHNPGALDTYTWTGINIDERRRRINDSISDDIAKYGHPYGVPAEDNHGLSGQTVLHHMFQMQLQKHSLGAATAPKPGIPRAPMKGPAGPTVGPSLYTPSN